jgi:hypothetical protein
LGHAEDGKCERAPFITAEQLLAVRLAVWPPAWRTQSGFAAVSATALDPPHSAASPAVPALLGPGPLADSAAVRIQAAVAWRSTIRMNSRAISR